MLAFYLSLSLSRWCNESLYAKKKKKNLFALKGFATANEYYVESFALCNTQKREFFFAKDQTGKVELKILMYRKRYG